MKTLTSIILILFISFSNLFSQQSNTGIERFTATSITEKALLKQRLLFDSGNENDSQIAKEDNKNLQKLKEKSVGLAVGMSALIPGAGQFYAKNYWKAAIFLGIEAIAWTTFALFEVKGNNQTESYQNYADQYWTIQRYATWLNDLFQAGLNPNDPDIERLRRAINDFEASKFSHTLPELKSQQYYEMIGKYQNFQGGWTNLQHVPDNSPGSQYYWESYRDPIFLYYSDERQKANDYYGYGKIGIYAVILNHILSAADAAWTVSIYNKEIRMQTGVGVNTYKKLYGNSLGFAPFIKLKATF